MSHTIGKLLAAAAAMTLALAGHAQTSSSETPPAAAPAPAPGQSPHTPCKRPEYPKSALLIGATGVSTISFLIATDGSVREAKVQQSSGYASLDEAALNALSRCRFKPATKDGQAVEAWQPVKYVWSIE